MKILPITQKKKTSCQKKISNEIPNQLEGGGGLQRHVYVTITINISLFSFQILTFYRIRKWGRGVCSFWYFNFFCKFRNNYVCCEKKRGLAPPQSYMCLMVRSNFTKKGRGRGLSPPRPPPRFRNQCNMEVPHTTLIALCFIEYCS